MGGVDGGLTTTKRKRYPRSVMAIKTGTTQARDPFISFSNKDYKGMSPHQDDPMVISIVAIEYKIEKVLLDQGSSANILYWNTFWKLQLPKLQLEDCPSTLIEFSGEQVEIRGNPTFGYEVSSGWKGRNHPSGPIDCSKML
ncbi:hypothetical protein CR513_61443, partial [Mucuna pruriens]